MIIMYGNILENYGKKNNYILITTNASITKHNRLIMGGGIAKEVQNYYKEGDLPKDAYDLIAENAPKINDNLFAPYHILFFPSSIALFQTKNEVYKNSDVNLIVGGLKRLNIIAKSFPHYVFHLPRPGCGLGGLSWDNCIKKHCETYLTTNNVWIWHFKQGQ